MKKYIPDSLALFRFLCSSNFIFVITRWNRWRVNVSSSNNCFYCCLDRLFWWPTSKKMGCIFKDRSIFRYNCDKIFITFIFVGFTYIERVSIWITVLLIVREFIITGLRGLAGNEGIMIPPSKLGKAKASLQFWAIGFVMMDFPITLLSFTLADFIVLLALVFSYISGYQYLSGYLQQTKWNITIYSLQVPLESLVSHF